MASHSQSLVNTSVLVTGGAGFIGSSLVERLVKEGAKVRVLDNFHRGLRTNLSAVQADIELITGDILDPKTLAQAVQSVDTVFHLAAVTSVPRSIQDPMLTNDVNIRGTLALLDASRSAGVKRLVFASSSSVYGANRRVPNRESYRPRPISPYAVSKLTGEMYCNVFRFLWGLETVSLRYFNIYGPRQQASSDYAPVIPKFITAMLRGERPTVFGDGNQRRDFTYVDNVVAANVLAATEPSMADKAFNIGGGQRITINHLVESLNSILGTDIEPRYERPRLGDVRDTWADISLARRMLGYVPVVGFEEGLKRTVEYFKENS